MTRRRRAADTTTRLGGRTAAATVDATTDRNHEPSVDGRREEGPPRR